MAWLVLLKIKLSGSMSDTNTNPASIDEKLREYEVTLQNKIQPNESESGSDKTWLCKKMQELNLYQTLAIYIYINFAIIYIIFARFHTILAGLGPRKIRSPGTMMDKI